MATVNEKMTTIADAIRDKTGGTEALTLDGMAENIPKVYELGKVKGITDFQNMLSNDGKRATWRNVFEGADFSGYTFNPTIYPTQLGSIFYNYSGAEFPKGIDFSKANNATSVTDTAKIPYQLFSYCRGVGHIPDMNIPVQYYYTYTFRSCGAKKIDIIRVTKITQFSNSFLGCDFLEEVTFEGVIGQNISFASSPLIVKCTKHIIERLYDYSAESPFTYTLTLKDSCKTELEADTEMVEFNGQNYTYFELITAKGWNLA